MRTGLRSRRQRPKQRLGVAKLAVEPALTLDGEITDGGRAAPS
jgi:hypothetical protein